MDSYKGSNIRKRKDRSKKRKALEGECYKKAIAILAQRDVLPEWIEKIYIRCQERQQTKISRDTLAIKLVELLNYIEERNKNAREGDEGYISTEDVINMILKNPRIINSDINNNIIPKCTVITQKNDDNVLLANIKIKSNPGVFRKSIKNIREGK